MEIISSRCQLNGYSLQIIAYYKYKYITRKIFSLTFYYSNLMLIVSLRTRKLRYESRCRQSLPEIVLIVRIYYVPPSDSSIMEELTISKFNGI